MGILKMVLRILKNIDGLKSLIGIKPSKEKFNRLISPPWLGMVIQVIIRNIRIRLNCQ